MSVRAQAAVLLVFAGALTRLTASGRYRWFVHERMDVLLFATAAVMAAVGVAGLWLASGPDVVGHRCAGSHHHHGDTAGCGDRPGSGSGSGSGDGVQVPTSGVPMVSVADQADVGGHSHGHEHGHEHSHSHGQGRVGWFLLVPLLVLGLVAPGPLMADSGARFSLSTLVESTSSEMVEPGQVLTLRRFIVAAVNDNPSLPGTPVRLVGVASEGVGDRFVLSRLSIGCCAADAFKLQVAVSGTVSPDNGSWVEVTGVWVPPVGGFAADGSQLVELAASKVVVLPGPPENPYE